jgi:hypothetical protein
MACKYLYKGELYTREELKGLINFGEFANEKVVQNAVKWLETKLGLTEEVIINSGFIDFDKKTVGRLLKDGKILLSQFMEAGDEYHEAFHRVFKMFLTEEQQADLLAEVKALPNWKKLRNKYKENYSDYTDDQIAEEIMAEKYRTFVLTQGEDYKAPGPAIASFFKWLWKMLNALVGRDVKTKVTMKEIFNQINAAKFKGVPLRTEVEEADKRIEIVDNEGNKHPLTMNEKNEIIKGLNTQFLSSIFSNGHSIYDLIDGSLDVKSMYFDAVGDILTQMDDYANESGNGRTRELHTLLFKELMVAVPNKDGDISWEVDMNSPIVEAHQDFLRSLGVKLDIKNPERDVQEADTNDPEKTEKDTAYMKVSFEFDPKASMTKAVKLLLASTNNYNVDGSVMKGDLGIWETTDWNNAMTTILFEMAGTPNNSDIFIKKLSDLSNKHPFIKDVVNHIGGRAPKHISAETLRLRNEFMQAFTKNKYTFLLAQYDGNDIYIHNANMNTRMDKQFSQWVSNMLKKHSTKESLYRAITHNGINRDMRMMADALGFEELGTTAPADFKVKMDTLIDEGGTVKTVADKLKDIRDKLKLSIEESGIPLQDLLASQRANDGIYNVHGSVKKLAREVAQEKIPVDLMLFNAEGKMIYNISMNTYQTVLINTLNYVASITDPDYKKARELRLQELEKQLPHIVNINNFERDKNGALVTSSLWLNEILQGRPIYLNVFDGVNIGSSGKKKALSDVNETDLYIMTINSLLQGEALSLKHSDRSTFFTYGFKNGKPLVDTFEKASIVETTIKQLRRYLRDEIRRTQAFNGPQKLGAKVKLYNSKANELTMFSFLKDELGESAYNKLLNTKPDKLDAELNDRAITDALNNYVDSEIKQIEEDMAEWKLTEQMYGTPIGLSKELWDKYKKNMNNVYAAIAANSLINHVEESKILVGDFAFYKNATDLYKRLSMQSSTGDTSTVDKVTNDFITKENNRDSFDIHVNDGTNATVVKDFKYDKEIDGSMPEFVAEEIEKYVAQGVFDNTFEKVFKDGNVPDYLIEAYLESYKKGNENDGMSYINIFAYRELHLRQGGWSHKHENTFQVELAALKLAKREELSDLEVYYTIEEREDIYGVKSEKIKISSKEIEGYTKVKIFQDKAIKDMPTTKLFEQAFASFTPLKPQYTGPMYTTSVSLFEKADPLSRLNIVAGRKTAYFPLQPTIVLGTKLQQLNALLLTNNTDAMHFGSAAKFGVIDAKKAGKTQDVKDRGARFYDTEGNFNYKNLDEELKAGTIKSFLNYKYMKLQLPIANKPKDKIKNSTQSAKIIISNLIVKGIPRDVQLTEDFKRSDWNKLNTQAKKEMSPIFKMVEEYKDLLYKTVIKNKTALERELDVAKNEIGIDQINDLSKLVEKLTKQAEDRNESDVILDSINKFAEHEVLEILPNKTRIENILFSIITNNAIVFKRPGNGVPQLTVTGMEDIGQPRIMNDDGTISAKGALKFYEVNEDGSLRPAETIIPFPKKLFKTLLRISKKDNIAEAVDWINDQIDPSSKNFNKALKDSVTYKALRIPNQQLGSNDVFTVKRFTLPLLENYAIVPSEIVVKGGSDFDIDKLSMYFNNYDRNLLPRKAPKTVEGRYIQYVAEAIPNVYEEMGDQRETALTSVEFMALEADLLSFELFKQLPEEEQVTASVLQNRLLKAEMDILLHQSNAHILLAPLVDDVLSKIAVAKILGEIGLGMSPARAAQATANKELVGVISYPDILRLRTNIEKTINYIGGKQGVGQVATQITGHSMAMSDTLTLNPNFNAGGKKPWTTNLPFEEVKTSRMDGMYDTEGYTIMEVLSALITSQMDVGKDPYSVELGINNQTLNVISYLLRRGMHIIDVLMFVKQPLIQKYLKEQRINESLAYERFGSRMQKSSFNFLSSFLMDNGYDPDRYSWQRKQIGEGKLITTTKNLESDLRNNKNQLEHLAAFDVLTKHSKAFKKYEKEFTPDTKPLKDMASNDVLRNNRTDLMNQGMVKIDRENSVLRPFFEVRDMYPGLYTRFYLTRTSQRDGQLDDLREGVGELQYGDDKKAKAMNTVDNDFILYLLQNYAQDFNERTFQELFISTNSVPKRLLNIAKSDTHRLKDNGFVKEAVFLIKNRKDPTLGSHVDNMRLFNRAFNTLSLNDLADAMEEIESVDEQLYKDIVLFNFYQQGLNNSPFNFDKVIPIDYRYELLQEVLDVELDGDAVRDFVKMFALNHPELIPSNPSAAGRSKIPYMKVIDPDTRLEYVAEIGPEGDIIRHYVPLGSTSYLKYRMEFEKYAYDPTLDRTDLNPEVVFATDTETPQSESIPEADNFEGLDQSMYGELEEGDFEDTAMGTMTSQVFNERKAAFVATNEVKFGIRHKDGVRKRFSLKNYSSTLARTQKLNKANPDFRFSIIKISGEKGDKRVYNAIKMDLRDQDFSNELKLYIKNNSTKSTVKNIAESSHKYAPLAQKLLELMTDDMPIEIVNNKTMLGRYSRKDHKIYMSSTGYFNIKTKGDVVPTILHEVIHGLSVRTLDNINSPEVQAFNEIYQKALAARDSFRSTYPLRNSREFMTGIFTNETFMEDLSKLPGTEKKTLWQNVYEWVLSLLNLGEGNLYNDAFNAAVQVLNLDFNERVAFNSMYQNMEYMDALDNVEEGNFYEGMYQNTSHVPHQIKINKEVLGVKTEEQLFNKVYNKWEEVFPDKRKPNDEERYRIADGVASGQLKINNC